MSNRLPHARRQNSEVSPRERNNSCVSSTVRRRQSGDRRSRYQGSASFQVCSTLKVAPRGRLHILHHLSMCSSDRKISMVFQLKTMSSHQRLAGMAKCTVPAGVASTAPLQTLTIMLSPQHPQDVSTRPSHCIMEITPSASQMQFPYQLRDLVSACVSTTNGVGTAESGLAIRTSPLPGCRTSTWAAASSLKAAATLAASH